MTILLHLHFFNNKIKQECKISLSAFNEADNIFTLTVSTVCVAYCRSGNFACLNFRKFLILGLFPKYRIRDFFFLFSIAIIIIIFAGFLNLQM